MSVDPRIIEIKCCHTVDFDQIWSERKSFTPRRRTLSHSRLWPKVAQNVAPRWRTLSHSGLWPNVAKNFAPHQRTLSHSRLWPNVAQNFAPHRRTLSHSGLWPNVARNFAPHWRTLSHSGLWPNVAQECAPCWRTLLHSRLQPNVAQECAPHWKDCILMQTKVISKCMVSFTPIRYSAAVEKKTTLIATSNICSHNQCSRWQALTTNATFCLHFAINDADPMTKYTSPRLSSMYNRER